MRIYQRAIICFIFGYAVGKLMTVTQNYIGEEWQTFTILVNLFIIICCLCTLFLPSPAD